tara:strand:+ start:219 stop:404 length:186 start_codon:yes stop_codon:yes gene_type:complete
VLRNGDHPFQNLNLFSGIAPQRAAQLENWLKEDILREAAKVIFEETYIIVLNNLSIACERY